MLSSINVVFEIAKSILGGIHSNLLHYVNIC